jgi:hypothetical protein
MLCHPDKTGEHEEHVSASALIPRLGSRKAAIKAKLEATTTKTANIRSLHASHDSSVPASDIQEQGKRVEQKFLALSRRTLGDETAQRIAFESSLFPKGNLQSGS